MTETRSIMQPVVYPEHFLSGEVEISDVYTLDPFEQR